jgi:hypothetical protein
VVARAAVTMWSDAGQVQPIAGLSKIWIWYNSKKLKVILLVQRYFIFTRSLIFNIIIIPIEVR